MNFKGDDVEKIVEKKQLLPVIGAALVYHDLGLWTDHVLSYLEPSWDRAEKKYRGTFSEEQLVLLHDIIDAHHKITPFEGPNAVVVNAVRKADWIDASQGLISKSMPRHHIHAVLQHIPNAGFHDALLQFGPKLYGWNVFAIVKGVFGIFRL